MKVVVAIIINVIFYGVLIHFIKKSFQQIYYNLSTAGKIGRILAILAIIFIIIPSIGVLIWLFLQQIINVAAFIAVIIVLIVVSFFM